MARPRLTTEEKAKRGTLRASREREYFGLASAGAVSAVAPKVTEPLVKARDYIGIAAQYRADIASGRIIANRWVKLACARQTKDLAHAALEPAWTYTWDPDEAIAACHFLECLPHVEGRWSSALLRLEPWQIFLVTTLYGWRVRLRPASRRFTTCFFEVGRKSAKTTLAAGLGLYHGIREDEPGASVVCGATTGSQARMAFAIMQKMGRRSAWLRAQGVQVFANAILFEDGEAKPINAKASTQDGLNPSMIILDESHAQDFTLHNVLVSAQGARANPLMLCPTTAGYDLLSVGYAMHQQAEKVLSGVLENERLLCAIYALDEEDDPQDERTWIKAVPMVGVSPSLDYVRDFALKALQLPGVDVEFLVKICNRWTRAASAWLPLGAWDKCARPGGLTLDMFKGKRCWIGADLAEVDDLTALAFLFEDPVSAAVQAKPEPDKTTLLAIVRCYLPEGVVEERARAVPQYRDWTAAGLLVPTEGSMTDYNRIEADLREDCKKLDLVQGVFDYFGSAQIAASLAGSGLPFIREPKNARTFSDPAKNLAARVKAGRFGHDGSLLLRWAASNVRVTMGVDGSILPKKETADSANKIDPIDAIISALGAYMRTTAQRPKEYQVLIIGGGTA